MRSYFGWKVEEGSLWEVRPQHWLIGDWKTESRFASPTTVAAADVEGHLSTSAMAPTKLTTRTKMFAEKSSSQMVSSPAFRQLAVGQHGAAGSSATCPIRPPHGPD